MERLQLSSGATLTETSAPGTGEVIAVSGNNDGVWVVGNARDAGAFSATVQLLKTATFASGACAYASNYPPVGEYISATEIAFTGTPGYDLVFVGGATTHTESSPYTVPDGFMVQSFTDKTGAPGKLGCIPMTGNIDFLPINASKGFGVSFAVTQHPTLPSAAAITYTWSAPDFTPSSGIGISYTPAAPATAGTYEVVLTARSEGYCDLEASKTVTVIECVPSTIYTLTASATGFCEGDAGVTFALSGTESGRSYELYRDDAPTAVTLVSIGGAATFSSIMDEPGTYTAKVLASGDYCEAVMNGSLVISRNPLPTAPVIDNPNDVCLNDGDIVFTASGYSGELNWVSVTSGGTTATNSVTFSSGAATGTKTVTARSAQSYSSTLTCYSGQVTQSANVNPLPTINNANSPSRCNAGAVTLTATASGGTTTAMTYTWTVGGTPYTTTTNSYTTGSLSSSSAYTVRVTNENNCESNTASGNIAVNFPGTNEQSSLLCGCATGTIDCSGTCKNDVNYTTNDGSCTGSCTQYAYVQQRNACGTVINSTYSTYANSGCYASSYYTYDGACTGSCKTRYMQLHNGCTGAVTSSQAGTFSDDSCTSGCCTTYTRADFDTGIAVGSLDALRAANVFCTSACAQRGWPTYEIWNGPQNYRCHCVETVCN
jgi:hypothetical protein